MFKNGNKLELMLIVDLDEFKHIYKLAVQQKWETISRLCDMKLLWKDR